MSGTRFLRSWRLTTPCLLLLVLSSALAAWAGPPSGFERVSSESVAVARSARLEVVNLLGTITIEGWDGDTVELQADHQARDRVNVVQSGAVWHIGPDIEGTAPGDVVLDPPDRAVLRLKDAKAMPGVIDLWLRVPRWLPVLVEGLQTDVSVRDTAAPLELAILSGQIAVRDHAASLQVRAFSGSLDFERVSGAIDIDGSEQPIRLRDCRGAVRIEASVGDLELENIEASVLEASTVRGNIVLRGALATNGRYELSTHFGTIELHLPPEAGVEASLRTHRGRLEVQAPGVEPPGPRQKRWSATLGDGTARLRADAFAGDVRLERR